AQTAVRNVRIQNEDFIWDLTLFQGLSSPTMSLPTTPRNAGSSWNCEDNVQWFRSSAAEVSAPRTARRPKGLLNSILSSSPVLSFIRFTKLLVLRRAHSWRSPPGPGCRYQEMPAGLG